ncbi:OmpW family outer membrane protein [Hyphobacterium sp. HN65]|uniref:OmpW family outer membrane protein n=1 Tax=Hyphobacterium lacteum TaxID=3116575 RepID=A0ABU7LNA1_9PROT|nr:OmpW family outer membrane protein [Hyphobacterium sp. HN65]MEE2525385.1 OmpW family outer membrane protein [Hyphobacterium sp. HN65]
MNKLFLTTALVALAAASAADAAEGDWVFRLRALSVAPSESATITPIGGDVDISNSVVPELDISYFFTDHFAAELILGVTPHDVMAVNTAAGNVDLGSVTLLPPTLTFQYHFQPEASFRPYVGAGVNYTVFFNDALPTGGTATSISYDNSFGLAAQIGADIDLNETWFLNVDLKWVDINTDVTINNTIMADVDIDPWIFGIGIGRRF